MAALKAISAVLEEQRDILLSLDKDTPEPDTIRGFCLSANRAIARMKPFLGLLIRSSNLRNAFEMYFPVKMLATELVDTSVSVILGSEWAFSPLAYPSELPELPNFVFIGLPATECENPLILPLAAHELGHVIWRRRGLRGEIEKAVKAEVISIFRESVRDGSFRIESRKKIEDDDIESDLFIRRFWTTSDNLTKRQLEELFCDFVGVYIFGEAYFRAFEYLLSPSISQYRDVRYPLLPVRAKYMEEAANQFNIVVPDGFSEAFEQYNPSLTAEDRFMVDVADKTTAALRSKLYELVSISIGSANSYPRLSDDEAAHIVSCFKQTVPPAIVRSPAAVVNAGWKLDSEIDRWDVVVAPADDPIKARKEKRRILRDLMLKSFEVYEFGKRVDHAGGQ